MAVAVRVRVQVLVNDGVAVVVEPVAELVRSRVHVHRVVVAVPRALGVSIVVLVKALVDGPVAVVVQPVAGLHRERPDQDVAVIAVPATGCDPVAVRVEALIGVPVAVVVDKVTHLFRTGIDLEGRVVAVQIVVNKVPGLITGAHGHIGVAVRVAIVVEIEPVSEPLIDVRVTVVIKAIANLWGPRVHGDFVVVAIPGARGPAIAVLVL